MGLQGVNVLPGSFMSGQMRWAVRGGIAVVAGIACWWGLTGNGNALDYPRCNCAIFLAEIATSRHARRARSAFRLELTTFTGRTKDPTLDNPQGLGTPPQLQDRSKAGPPPDKVFTAENTNNTEKASGVKNAVESNF